MSKIGLHNQQRKLYYRKKQTSTPFQVKILKRLIKMLLQKHIL